MRKVLVLTVLVELGTGVALIAKPAVVVRLLLGADLAGAGIVAGRCFGVALVALALACWPGRRADAGDRSAFRGMLVYNALICVNIGIRGTVPGISWIYVPDRNLGKTNRVSFPSNFSE